MQPDLSILQIGLYFISPALQNSGGEASRRIMSHMRRLLVKGLELSRNFYNACRPCLQEHLPDLLPAMATGLVGEGSECFGFDDEHSTDHDFGASFCIWMNDELLAKHNRRIQNALAKLPVQFMGFPVEMGEGGRRGAHGIKAFYSALTGLDHPPVSLVEWRHLPENRLAAAVNGEVFEDPEGSFSRWRAALLNFYPDDILYKKIAARVMTMAQSGQYNLPRSLRRSDGIAAMLSCARFAEASLSFIFLLNRQYMPFYKWAGKKVRSLPVLGHELAELLDLLAAHPLRSARDLPIVEKIEEFCDACAAHLRALGLSVSNDSWLWTHGPEIARHIKDRNLRSANLLED